MSSVWYFPIHAYPDDYWRFSASGFASLLKDFEVVANIMSGHPRFPHTVCAVASKGPLRPDLEQALRSSVAEWKERESNSWKEVALTAAPPFVSVSMYEVFRRIQTLRNRPSRPR